MDTFVRLTTLVHLTELKISSVKIDIDTLERARPVQMHRVRKFDLQFSRLVGTDSLNIFCRFISTIFPNIEELILYLFATVKVSSRREMRITFFVHPSSPPFHWTHWFLLLHSRP